MLNKRLRKLLKQIGRDTVEQRSRGCETERNAQIRAMLDRTVVDGKYGVILSGRDCDCSQYYRESVETAPRSVAEFKREWDKHCEWLDGPETQRFVRPDEIVPQHVSRDLAMEAYEDGHPSVVYPYSDSELRRTA